jgi:hypothetical protein
LRRPGSAVDDERGGHEQQYEDQVELSDTGPSFTKTVAAERDGNHGSEEEEGERHLHRWETDRFAVTWPLVHNCDQSKCDQPVGGGDGNEHRGNGGKRQIEGQKAVCQGITV